MKITIYSRYIPSFTKNIRLNFYPHLGVNNVMDYAMKFLHLFTKHKKQKTVEPQGSIFSYEKLQL